MVQSRSLIQAIAALLKLLLVFRKGQAASSAEPPSTLILSNPHERMFELTEFYRIAVWARNFRASRSVSIGKGLSSYGGASIGGAHHVRE